MNRNRPGVAHPVVELEAVLRGRERYDGKWPTADNGSRCGQGIRGLPVELVAGLPRRGNFDSRSHQT
jgi:hypothetical protein